MPQAFQRAFAMKVGALSPVITSPYGFHLLLLLGRQPPAKESRKEAEQRVRRSLRRRHAAEIERRWLARLRRENRVVVNREVMKRVLRQ